MTKPEKLWIAWGCMYLLCAACGFIPVTSKPLYGLFFLFSLGFFIPGGMLLHYAITRKEKRLILAIRIISLVSLLLTLLLILMNFATARESVAVGNAMYWLLIIFSTPMICSQVWVVSMFGWALLLMTTIFYVKKK